MFTGIVTHRGALESLESHGELLAEEMGRVGVSIPLTHVSACSRTIAHQGTAYQKQRYLPDMASGKKISASS